MFSQKRQPLTYLYQTRNTGGQQMKQTQKVITENHPSWLHFQAGVKYLGKSSDWWQLCFQLYPNPVFSLIVCPHCSTLCGLRFLFGCDQHWTWPPHDLEKETFWKCLSAFQITKFINNGDIYNKVRDAWSLPIILLKISGGSWGFGQSSPVKVFRRPCRECVAKVSLSKSIISSADVYFL